MIENTLLTQRTARYFTLGNYNENTKEVWIVLHGFAQLASEFLESFKAFHSNEKCIVAPEALNRFYTKGYSGKVAATWMTKEARELDIQDNIQYLDNLIASLNINREKSKVITLAFSQGVATLTRWLNRSNFKPDALVMYAGEMAHELKTKPLPQFLHHTKCYFIYGTKDPLLPAFAPDTLKNVFSEIQLSIIEFEGEHEIDIKALEKIRI
jgi:predicted esterase